MEYGEAINAEISDRALKIGQRLRKEGEPLWLAAKEAVHEAYCVCVTDGEDAAEHRLSDVHRDLIGDLVRRLKTTEAGGP